MRARHASERGFIDIRRDDSHGVAPGNPIRLNGLAEIPAKIGKVLVI